MRRNVKSRLKRDFFLTVEEAMKTELFEQISRFTTPILESIKGYLVDLNMRGEGGTTVLEVFVDTDKGITADECAEVSRSLSAEIERQSIFTGRYRIEVSSPGLERPLKLERQFRKNIGRQLRIITNANSEPLTGILEEVTETSLTLSTGEKQSVPLALKDIRETYVLPRFK
jgi:ribosome maturation factor RimP